MDATRLEELSLLFKALADPARLRILGLLAERPHAGHELADRLALTPPTISHHMRRLVAARLVDVAPDAQTRIYSLRTDTIRDLSGSILNDQTQQPDNAEDNAVLRAFFDGPRLRQIPAARKKRVIVLRRLLERFAPDRAYREAEVNDLLREAHDDVATLRRELVDYGFMVRDRGIYRIATELPARGSTVAQEVGNEQTWFERLVAAATARAINGRDLPAAETPAGQPE
ncbi:MAG: ArsR family transcriptional regulator [Thermomicrobiales bacterium]|nr:ArsR family transcriptional regulator [Thermomicrobiales bacterium]